MLITDRPPYLFSHAKAEEAVVEMQELETEGWTYKTKPKGKYSIIEAYDEEGEYAGTF
jgi:hypothetical protein